MSFDKRLEQKLAERKANHLYRSRIVMESPQGVEVIVDGKSYLNFCSNDYLGLANDPVVVSCFKAAAEHYGAGSGAAHLVSGHSAAHHALEEELAEFVGRPRALLFSTGYMANLGVVSALTERHDTVIEDRLNHASLIDAAQLSRANMVRYKHADMTSLANELVKVERGQKLVVSDGVFSMDGDMAPVSGMAQLCHQHDAVLMIDDAHGLGVIGEQGRGTVSQLGLSNEDVPILVGTLGKAFGTFGAFVAGSEALIETLIQDARSYVYTTALPAAVAEATRASLKKVQSEQWRRDKLQQLIKYFKQGSAELGLDLMASDTAIQPVVVGDSEQAVRLSNALKEKGILISAIRPPTVPQGTARLRITFSATHETEHVDRLLQALAESRKG